MRVSFVCFGLHKYILPKTSTQNIDSIQVFAVVSLLLRVFRPKMCIETMFRVDIFVICVEDTREERLYLHNLVVSFSV